MAKQQHRPASCQGLLAFEDRQFLLRDEMRAHRLALEFERAEIKLRDQRIRSTIVVFGSSRTKRETTSKAARQGARKHEPLNSGSVSAVNMAAWYEEARSFARLVSERGGALAAGDGPRENVITTGGGPGIMEAANRGAADAGAPSIGFNIQIPSEQEPNSFITPSLCFHFHYFAIRKMHFAMRANALAVFPGGFGTLDEVFEILTLKQTRKTRGMPVILFCRHFWNSVVDLKTLAEYGAIDPDDLDLFDIVDTAEEGWQRMVQRGLTLSTPLRED